MAKPRTPVLTSAAACALLLAAPARADDAKAVRALIEPSVGQALKALKDKSLDRQARKKKVLAIVDPVFDFPLIAKLTLGRKNWPKFDPEQQKRFTELFVRFVQDSYYDKVDLLTDEAVEFREPQPAEKGKWQMMTEVLSKGDRHLMLYKVYKKDDAWKIYDIELAGISLVKSYGAQYDQFLEKNSVEDLLKKLADKSLEQPAELKRKDKGKGQGEEKAPAGKP